MNVTNSLATQSQETMNMLVKSLCLGAPYQEKITSVIIPRAPSESALRDTMPAGPLRGLKWSYQKQ